jgi:hypothetical protein
MPRAIAAADAGVEPAPTAVVAMAGGLSVADVAKRLGIHRTRVYALLNAGDLVALRPTMPTARAGRSASTLRAWGRWQAAGGAGGSPLALRTAWALIGLASGDSPAVSAAWACSSTARRGPARGLDCPGRVSRTWLRACAGAPRC